MNRHIPSELRKNIVLQAGRRCEYCRLPDADSFYGFQIDHIISRKHGGKTQSDNLAYACPDCNRYKGTDLGTYLNNSSKLVRFFHPRFDDWGEHFELDDSGFISAKTEIGYATLKILLINHADRIIERKLLWRLGLL